MADVNKLLTWITKRPSWAFYFILIWQLEQVKNLLKLDLVKQFMEYFLPCFSSTKMKISRLFLKTYVL